jgi:hypothetical protein
MVKRQANPDKGFAVRDVMLAGIQSKHRSF